MNWTQEQYDEYRRKNIGHKNISSIPLAYLEQTVGLSPLATEKDKGLDTRCGKASIVVKSYRHRLADPDGISCKAVLDQIVTSGVLPDDSTDHIEEVLYRQFKIPKTAEENTIVEIWRRH